MTSPSTSDANDQLCGKLSTNKKAVVTVALVLFVGAAVVGFGYFFQPISDGPAPHTLLARDPNLGVYARLFSPDGKYLVTDTWSSKENNLDVWDVVKKQKLRSVKLPRQAIAVSISAKADLLAVAYGRPAEKSANDDGKPRGVRLFEFPGLKELVTFDSEFLIRSMALSPDGKLLATTAENQLSVWEIATRKSKYAIDNVTWPVRFSPDGKTVAVRGPEFLDRGIKNRGSVIRRYEAESGKPLDVIGKDRDLFGDFDYFPDGKRMLVNGIGAYDIATGDSSTLYQLEAGGFRKIRHPVLSADGQWLVFAIDEDGLRGRRQMTPELVIFDLQTKKIHKQWTVPPHDSSKQWVGSVAISADKKNIAVVASGALYLYEIGK